MNVTIQGTNININEHVEEYAHKKLSKLDRYLPNISEVRVEVTRDNTRRGEDFTVAQITLHHSRGAILRSEERLRGEDNETTQAAINGAVDKMHRRIERFKGKRTDSRRRGQEHRYIATLEELESAEEIPQPETAPMDGATEFDEVGEIVRRKVVELVPMDESEAIAQMELLGHSFFMFLNAESGKLNVLYRRGSGGYGVLVPQNS